jgi:site-specific DNA recombinase
MMKRAVIYTRVSTDEQADRGYSLGVQRDQLEKYCESKNIEILKVYVDDHSAKSFDRPQFKEFLNYAKTHHPYIDYFLFVSWDRFSRNAPDAYEMLGRLKKWNIEAQAIMQPIDFSVPQNKVMLSIYLTLPEVDNDIRSQKVRSGMRGANKLGRWVRQAPMGYKNRRDEVNKPIIVPAENAYLIREAFEEIVKDVRTLNDIRLELNRKGFKVSRSNFSILVRNPVYIGKIVIPAFEDEPEQIVEGLHEGIVSEELFNEVQLVLSGRKKKLNKHNCTVKDREELPLRGLLSCSNCGNHVTGSASKSKSGKKHFYYHCMKCGKERFRADLVNGELEQLLEAIQITEEVEQLHALILEKELQGNVKTKAQQLSTFTQELTKLEERKAQLQKTFLAGQITPSDYSELKPIIENQLMDLKSKIGKLKGQNNTLSQQLNEKLMILPNLVEGYRNSGIQDKKELLCSIFEGKFLFEKNQVRTPKINPIVSMILRYTGRFVEKKKGQTKYFYSLSRLVIRLGFEPRTHTLKVYCSTS